jgi:hypothetical protein
MAGDGPETGRWERCRECGNGLWRVYADRLEMVVSPRGGQRRVISASIEGLSGLRVTCEKCGRTWAAAA